MNWAVCMMTCGVIFLVVGGAVMCWSYIYDEPANTLVLLYWAGLPLLVGGSLFELQNRDHTRRMETCPVYRAGQEERCRTKRWLQVRGVSAMNGSITGLIAGLVMIGVGVAGMYLMVTNTDWTGWFLLPSFALPTGVPLAAIYGGKCYDSYARRRRMGVCPVYRAKQEAIQEERCRTKSGCRCGECRP